MGGGGFGWGLAGFIWVGVWLGFVWVMKDLVRIWLGCLGWGYGCLQWNLAGFAWVCFELWKM